MKNFPRIAALLTILLALTISRAYPKDPNNQYAGSPLKPWFDSLTSKMGSCCSDADGAVLIDTDWETHDGRYRVRMTDKRFPEAGPQWFDVPPEAVLEQPNRDGRTIVWPLYGVYGLTIRCFIPGSMT